jgi:hypothetical protein
MPEHSDESWWQYLEAALRKHEITAYHFTQLKEVLNPAKPPQRLTVPIQAHFEGVVLSAMAAVDQVAQAVNSALGLGLSASNLVQRAFGTISPSLPQVREWYENPLGRDLRSIRTKMVHYSYSKTPQPPRLQWEIQRASNNAYAGSRELVAYSSAAVQYINKLAALIPTIGDELRRRARLKCATKRGDGMSGKLHRLYR